MKEWRRLDHEAFARLIDTIIDAVDGQDFIASLDPQAGLGNLFVGSDPEMGKFIHEVVDTREGKAARKLFAQWQHCIDERLPEIGKIERVMLHIVGAAELLPLAVGFAAGLRAAGASKRQAQVILAGYLRHFRND
jgi:hypothetical protein